MLQVERGNFRNTVPNKKTPQQISLGNLNNIKGAQNSVLKVNILLSNLMHLNKIGFISKSTPRHQE